MLIASQLNPPIHYSIIWLVIGIILLAAIPISFGLVMWFTRRRPLKSLEGLAQLPFTSELDRLKAKYLQLIDEASVRYQRHDTTLRELHKELSKIARDFVYEAKHYPAPRLTLADLRLSPYPTLAKLISDLYPDEFAAMERGDATGAVQAAKGFIHQWV